MSKSAQIVAMAAVAEGDVPSANERMMIRVAFSAESFAGFMRGAEAAASALTNLAVLTLTFTAMLLGAYWQIQNPTLKHMFPIATFLFLNVLWRLGKKREREQEKYVDDGIALSEKNGVFEGALHTRREQITYTSYWEMSRVNWAIFGTFMALLGFTFVEVLKFAH